MALSIDCQRKGQKIIAVKQAIRDQSASFIKQNLFLDI